MIHILLQSQQERIELATILNRGLNCLNPLDWPKWAQTLVDKLQNCDNLQMHRVEPQHDQSIKVGVTD